MRAPALRGRIDRRISVFYRLDPMAARELLPAPLRPRLVRGWALGGVCILRLARMRPRMLPIPLGLASELAWHRIAVEWEEDGRPMHGHYLLRSETDSRLAPFPGARLVPSPDDCTRIEVRSSDAALTARVESGDGTTDLDLAASLGGWRSDALFKSANAARASIASGHVVWDGDEQGELEGVELRSTGGTAQGLEVVRLASTWFDDRARFSLGTATLDCAIVVRDADHEWHAPASQAARVERGGAGSTLPLPAP
jgi:hypothetical protein